MQKTGKQKNKGNITEAGIDSTHFVRLSLCVQSASSRCRQHSQAMGREGGLLPSMEIDDREEGRLSTVEVPVGDTGKKGKEGRACVEAWWH